MDGFLGALQAIWNGWAIPITIYGFTFTLRSLFLFVAVLGIVVSFLRGLLDV